MPVVTITIAAGYDEETRQILAERLTDAVRTTVAAPLDDITVTVNEDPGQAAPALAMPPPRPAKLVRAYLDACGARDFDTARTMLAGDFLSLFPGGAEMRDPGELPAFAKGRYKSVRKVYEHVDEAVAGDGVAVYAFGTLEGEWEDGAPFSGIRFIDRFTVRDGKIADQRVWNDVGETQLAAFRAAAAEAAQAAE
jgi:phenylpyruvate tautomerase PptA (4-oxalocrotonate tautomerase family)/ketosteroid isomerase-like protein